MPTHAPFPTNGGGGSDPEPMPKGGEHVSTPAAPGGKFTQGPAGSPPVDAGSYPGTNSGGK